MTNSATGEPTEGADQIATSVALTLEAWVPERDTPVPEPNNTVADEPVLEPGNAVTPTPARIGDLTMLSTDYENALPVEMQMIIGTLEIDQHGQSISPDQAAVLQPLWQDLRTLVESGSDQTMITSQVAQIVQAMTSDQVTAIAAIQSSWEDLIRVSEAYGIEMGPSGNFPGKGAGDSQGTPLEGARDGAAGSPAGGTVTTGRGGASGNMSRINIALLDEVIEYLEKELVSPQ